MKLPKIKQKGVIKLKFMISRDQNLSFQVAEAALPCLAPPSLCLGKGWAQPSASALPFTMSLNVFESINAFTKCL